MAAHRHSTGCCNKRHVSAHWCRRRFVFTSLVVLATAKPVSQSATQQQPTSPSTSQPLNNNQPASRPVRHSTTIYQPVGRSACQPWACRQLIDQPTRHSAIQSATFQQQPSQSDSQSVRQPSGQTVSHSVSHFPAANQPVRQSDSQPIRQSDSEAVRHSVSHFPAANQPVSQSIRHPGLADIGGCSPMLAIFKAMLNNWALQALCNRKVRFAYRRATRRLRTAAIYEIFTLLGAITAVLPCCHEA
eukprot:350727-Chlamydomonas_euryale.AAC.4